MKLIFIFFLLTLSTKPLLADGKIKIPIDIPSTLDFTQTLKLKDAAGKLHDTTLNPELQAHLTKFIIDRGNPVAAVIVADVKTGRILAMAQGRAPEKWNSNVHSALHSLFPAASLFKTVVAGAAFDISEIDPTVSYGLEGGCGTVRPTGVWLNDQASTFRHQMSLFKAFGNSCNGFFAKLGVNMLGLKALADYARRFGWDGNMETDFAYDKSPINIPSVRASSVHAVGRFAAGFGSVGLSAIHATWMSLAIANNGVKKPIYILEESLKSKGDEDGGKSLSAKNPDHIMISRVASEKLRTIMEATVKGGTASFAFRRGKYRKFRDMIGGKTGTLSGHNPEGVTTWFAGMMPLAEPEVVVTAVVVLENLWHIKGPSLAAEAIWAYDEFVKKRSQLAEIPKDGPTH